MDGLVFVRVLYFTGKSLIREVREALGLTIVELAEKTGVHYTTVSEWELGKTVPRASRKNALSKVLGRSIEDLFPTHNLPKSIYEELLINYLWLMSASL